MSKQIKISKITLISLLVALSSILSLFDKYISNSISSIIPFISIFIPYFKLGIANVVILIFFKYLSNKEILLIGLLKSIIAGLIFSGMFAFIFSLFGTLISITVMLILRFGLKNDHYLWFVSMLGAITHMICQLVIYIILYRTMENIRDILLYAPYLLLASAISGVILGLIASKLSKYNIVKDVN